MTAHPAQPLQWPGTSPLRPSGPRFSRLEDGVTVRAASQDGESE